MATEPIMTISCEMVDDGMFCVTHNCGATDPEQCSLLGCPHCEAMQRLMGVLV